jgi:tripeptidyl-peptidase I
VAKYLTSLGGEYAGLYNSSGRGIPDIAAQGQNYSTIWNGTVRPVDGTSAATPTAAAIFALVNDALIAAGKPPMGFLNVSLARQLKQKDQDQGMTLTLGQQPWLYAGGFKGFHDILSGSSAGCNTTGFPARPGWDAVTGYGTPVSDTQLLFAV